MSDVIKDWRGTPIEVGDVILYAVKHSTSVEVNEAIVKEVVMKPEYSWSDRKIPTVIAEWQTSSDCYNAVSGRKTFIIDRTIRTVKLTNFEGITVVGKHSVPAFAREPEMVKFVGADHSADL